MEKARALGDSLRGSDEFLKLVEAQKLLDADTQAQELLKSYDAKRNELQVKQMGGQSLDSEIKQITEMENQIMSRESMQVYTKAEEDFKNLVDEANQEIVKAMEGNIKVEDSV